MANPLLDKSPLVFKVCQHTVWDSIRHLSVWDGSPDDLRDGFIHFSTLKQLPGTIQKHFAGQTNLVLLSVDVEKLHQPLRWELSRRGELFPHLYGPLPLAAVVAVKPLISHAKDDPLLIPIE